MNVDDIVQACLSDLEAGRATMADCLARYPEVEGLEVLLRSAQSLRRLNRLTLRPEASRVHEQRLRAALRAPARPQRRLARWPVLIAQQPAVRFGLAAVLVLALVVVSTGAASAASLPGQLLYPVKRTYERVQVRVTPSSGQAALHANLAEERSQELARLSERGSEASLLETTIEAMDAETSLSLDFVAQARAGQQAALLERIIGLIDRQQSILADVAARAPAHALAGLENAQQAIAAEREQAIAQLDAARKAAGIEALASPTATPRVPPGQTKIPPGQTKIPPGHTAEPTSTHVPPGQTRIPPGQTKTPPGQERVSPTPKPLRPTATSAGSRPRCGPTSAPTRCIRGRPASR